MKNYDIIVAGLGTAGSATCMALARRGFRVLGVDRHHPPHVFGSHHGASRSVRRAYLEGSAYVPMAMHSWELWRKLEADSGKRLLVVTPNLTIGPEDCPAVAGFMKSATAYDLPHRLMTSLEIRKQWPELNPPAHFVGGLEIEAGIVFPERSIATFLAEAEKAGADLIFNTEVESWIENKGCVRISTSSANYETGRLLISAGAWGGNLMNLSDHQLKAKRVPVHWFEAPRQGNYRHGNFPVNFWQVPEEDEQSPAERYVEFYSLPSLEGQNRIKVAFHNGLTDCDPDAVGRSVEQEEVQMIRDTIAHFLPGLVESRITSEVCMYTMTPDGDFYIGKRPGSDCVFGVALAGHGFKFAPVIGEILADLLTDIQPAFDLSLFSPLRLG